MILIIYGTRPEAIKLYPITHELEREEIGHIRLHTGQHETDELFHTSTLSLKNEEGYTTGAYLGRLVYGISDFIKHMKVKPQLTIVQGDTTSALAGALASHNTGIPVAHVEAGLRTGDLNYPWPEESNRRLIDHLSSLLFAINNNGLYNLRQEGIDPERIHVTGSTGIDTARQMIEWEDMDLDAQMNQVLITCHRRENWNKMDILFESIVELADEFQSWRFWWVKHHEPTRFIRARNMYYESATTHREMLWNMAVSKIVITDSGGLQEEAHYMRRPAIIVREKTERNDETHILTGMNKERIKSAVRQTILEPPVLDSNSYYGDGYSASTISRVIKEYLTKNEGR